MTEVEKPPAPPSAGNPQVQLGIGTLIIIALIVTMCSGRSETEKVQKDTAELKRQVGEINQKLDRLLPKDTVASDAVVESSDAGAAAAQKP